MLAMDGFHGRAEALFSFRVANGRHDQIPSVRGQLQGRLERDVQQLQHALFDDQGGAVAVLGQMFNQAETLRN